MPAPPTLRPIARRALAAQSDQRLVKLVREGHEPAFEEMVRRYRGPLVGFAAAIVSADGAEDVVQSSLVKAHRALLADSREITLRPWLFAIVRNGALNAIRGEPRVDELGEAAAAAAGPSEIAEQRDDLDRLVVAMCALPEAQRQALVKRELEGVGHGEIAAQLGTTATAVRGLIFRARIGLRDALGAAVPLPLLRTLMTEAPAVGLASSGAGAGAAALLGGGAAKGGTAIAAAIVALGTGIAIDQGRDGDSSKAGNVAAIERQADPEGGFSGGDAAAAPPIGSPDELGAGSATVESDRSGENGPGSGGGSEDGGSDSGGGAEPESQGASDGGGSGDESAPLPEADVSDDNSGPGGGSGGGPGPSSPGGGVDDIDVDDSSSGSSGSGSSGSGSSGSGSSGSGSSGPESGSSGSGSSGSGSTPPPPEAPPPPEIADDSGSSGSGSSGSGSGGGGSGSSDDG